MTEKSLEARIMEDLKQAMRDKNTVARDALRMLKADLMKEQIRVDDPNDAQKSVDEMGVVLRAVKTRRDSAEEYDKAGRPELAEKEREEIAALEIYLPKAMSEDEAREAITALAQKLGATEKKQMGQLMKAVRETYRGEIDGKLAAKIAGSLLS